MKNIYVSHLIDHLAEEISDEFYLKDVKLCQTKENAIPYLSLNLQDKTGMINSIGQGRRFSLLDYVLGWAENSR